MPWSEPQSSWVFESNGARMTVAVRENEARYHMEQARRCMLEASIARTIEHDHYLTPLEAAHATNALDEVREGRLRT